MNVAEGALLWTPSPERAAASGIARYMDWLRAGRRFDAADYAALHRWSVTQTDAFWGSVWDWCGVLHDGRVEAVVAGSGMRDRRWFTGARVNYAEHMLRQAAATPEATALWHATENRRLATTSWGELAARVRRLATALRALGVNPGDAVASYMPNVPETAVAMLAATAIGAVWTAAAPEFGVATVIERFAQVKPKVLFAADGYRFGGKDFARAEHVAAIAGALP